MSVDCHWQVFQEQHSSESLTLLHSTVGHSHETWGTGPVGHDVHGCTKYMAVVLLIRAET